MSPSSRDSPLPGLLFYGTDDVVFRNNSGSETVRVVANGVLTKK